MQRFQMYVDGKSVEASSGQWLESQNPFTGDAWAQIARGTAADADAAVSAAHKAFTQGSWSRLTASKRGLLMHKVGDLILRDVKKLAEAEVRENGRLFGEVQRQIAYLSQAFYYYGGLADKIQGAVIPVDRKGVFNFTRHEPLGVVAALTPWNGPLLVTCMIIAPALAAGCTVVIKPSEFSSTSTVEFAKLFEEAGFPPGVVNVVTGLGSEVGAALVSHPLVRGVAFTGSDATGRHINQEAAKDFKHVMLELGGKSPNIVFADADLDSAVHGAAAGIFMGTGQSCIAGSRLLLQDSIHDEFVKRLLAVVKGARMGDPMDPKTQLGPMSTQPQYDKVMNYIDIAKSEGAKVLLGGAASTRPECGKGLFIEPTIFGEVHNGMRIAQEEVFGPVLSVIRFKDEAEALTIANDVRFGLACGVWTGDIARALRMSEGIRAGTVWVNTYNHISFLSPFGGYKDSGLGRENGIDAVHEYLQVKSVWINTAGATANPFPAE